MEILQGTNAECTRNFSHGIIPTFYWIYIKLFNVDSNLIFSYGKKIKIPMEGFRLELMSNAKKYHYLTIH
jgi:hypothetical protein